MWQYLVPDYFTAVRVKMLECTPPAYRCVPSWLHPTAPPTIHHTGITMPENTSTCATATCATCATATATTATTATTTATTATTIMVSALSKIVAKALKAMLAANSKHRFREALSALAHPERATHVRVAFPPRDGDQRVILRVKGAEIGFHIVGDQVTGMPEMVEDADYVDEPRASYWKLCVYHDEARYVCVRVYCFCYQPRSLVGHVLLCCCMACNI